MDNANRMQCRQILPRYQRDTKRISETIKKNVRSTKPKRTPLGVPKTETLQGHKARDVYTSVYKVMNIVLSKQTGQSPTCSQGGNKYIMVMEEIDSNVILVEPIKNRKDEDLTRAYTEMMSRLRQSGIIKKNTY